MPLFYRHALGQVARLVDVAAAGDGRVVGDELQRDDAQQRLQGFERVRDVDDVVAVAADAGVALGGDGDDLAAAGADLFDVADDLLVLHAAGRDEYHRHALVDERDRAVLHLGGGHAL